MTDRMTATLTREQPSCAIFLVSSCLRHSLFCFGQDSQFWPAVILKRWARRERPPLMGRCAND